MQTKINELGRSMVEILGVLAVIGVLSVAGILGYKFAMNKYIANETVNELAIRANDIAYQMDKLIEANYAGEIEMELGNTTRIGYPIMARMSPQYTDVVMIMIVGVGLVRKACVYLVVGQKNNALKTVIIHIN